MFLFLEFKDIFFYFTYLFYDISNLVTIYCLTFQYCCENVMSVTLLLLNINLDVQH